MVSWCLFVLSFYPRDVLDEILDLKTGMGLKSRINYFSVIFVS